MSNTLSEQLEEYRAGWMQRVPADRRAIMERHIQHLTETGLPGAPSRLATRRPRSFCPTHRAKPSMSQRCWRKGPSS